jgi:hypothetical protein
MTTGIRAPSLAHAQTTTLERAATVAQIG